MKVNWNLKLLFALTPFIFLGCQAQVPHTTSDEFNAYWHAGKAELNTYELKQLRYGEMREGRTLLIFVTEDFNTKSQVKQETEDRANSTSVLKLNSMTQFVTGIYDYSLMTSVFTPVDINSFPHSLKVTSSSQDWCGQSFLQVNATGKKYDLQSFSYFQAEGDEQIQLEQTWLEDELWNRIRIDPQTLPMGKCKVVPASEYIKLQHISIASYDAVGSMNLEVTDEATHNEYFIYKLVYKELDRELVIRFRNQFPYLITGWEERLSSDGSLLSKGALKKTILEPYWEKNKVKDLPLRDTLLLSR